MKTIQKEPLGYIQPTRLSELWFHTGTTCNLRCPFCLEGSKPGDDRINPLTFNDARPFIDEAIELGVEQFSFTGGEPFVIPDIIRILEYTLKKRPCLILTNGTEPVLNRLSELLPLSQKLQRLKFRISLDYPDSARHDAGRGLGNFQKALDCLEKLHRYGFDVSVARQTEKKEDTNAINQSFYALFKAMGIPEDINIISFPDFLPPNSNANNPAISEDCMTRYHTEESRSTFMCNYTKFVLKKNGQMRVYACTLVDDDTSYDLGATLQESMNTRIFLHHHRCYSCFALGASCSEKYACSPD